MDPHACVGGVQDHGGSGMLIGFKSRFEPYILDGSKTHTIRRVKKVPPRVGEICHCYGDVRQKTMHLLGRWPCIAIDYITIKPVMVENWKSLGLDKPMVITLRVYINGDELSADEVETLFHRDGFRDVPPAYTSTAMARDFWRDNFKDGKPFIGQMIHWDFARPVAARATCYKGPDAHIQ